MKYRELIKDVQMKSGFSDAEAKDALDSIVTVLAVHLTEDERKKFASQLPKELQDMALAVGPTEETATQDVFEQFTEIQHTEPGRAKKQLLSAWEALKDTLSLGLVEKLRAQLPKKAAALLR